MKDWSKKRYWIVGASAGIGLALAKKMSEAGASLILTARNEARLKEIASTLPNEAEVLGGMPGAHRIVGIGQIDQFRTNLCGLCHQRHRIFVILSVGYFVQGAAKAEHMIVERRIGPV